MPGFTVDLQDFDDLVALLQRKRHGLTFVEKAIAISAEQVRGEAVRTIQRGPQRTGRVYSVNGKVATRSAPGEPLKSDTGHLASHIFARLKKGVRGATSSAEVGTAVWYGKYWEEDAPPDKRRPWLAPSMVKHRTAILRRVSKAVREAFKQ